VHRMPGPIRRWIAIPRMRDRSYPVLLDTDGEATAGLPSAEGEGHLDPARGPEGRRGAPSRNDRRGGRAARRRGAPGGLGCLWRPGEPFWRPRRLRRQLRLPCRNRCPGWRAVRLADTELLGGVASVKPESPPAPKPRARCHFLARMGARQGRACR
jgi:hypothetical protein